MIEKILIFTLVILTVILSIANAADIYVCAKRMQKIRKNEVKEESIISKIDRLIMLSYYVILSILLIVVSYYQGGNLAGRVRFLGLGIIGALIQPLGLVTIVFWIIFTREEKKIKEKNGMKKSNTE